jgi:Oligosaccharyltransferase subunit Ribophorin II
LEKFSGLKMSLRATLAVLFSSLCESALTAGYLADVDARYSPKPIIHHAFKPPHLRPNRVFAVIFLILATILRKNGVKLNMPSRPADFLFLGTLAAFIALLGSFFVALNLVQTVLLTFPILLLGWLAFPLQN